MVVAELPGTVARAGQSVRAQRVIGREVPYLSLWYKTNVAVARRDLTGVRLSPAADFLFLRGVARVASAPTAP